MGTTLDRRIAALEAACVPAAGLLLIAVQFVRPGRLDEPASTATFDGVRLARRDDESAEAFMERAEAGARVHYGADRSVAVMLLDAAGVAP